MQCDIVPEHAFKRKKGLIPRDLFHLFQLEANIFPSGFSFLINLGHFGGALQRSWRPLRIAQRFCKVWLNAHFASYRFFNPGSHGRFHFCSHTRSFLSTKRRSVAIYLVCRFCCFDLLCSDLFQALCILRHKCSEDVFKFDFGIERTAASSMASSFRFEVIS